MARGFDVRRPARIVLALVACACLLQGGEAGGARAAGLGGYKGSAQADGVHAFYNPQGVLPLPPFVDIGAPDALATITSGPSTFARAGVLDPGDLLANPDPLLVAASSDNKSGTIPSYPYRIIATSGYGAPYSESTPAPGLDARVFADTKGSTAEATTAQAVAPAIVTFGSMTSTATTTTDGSTVTVHARSYIGGINVLGILTIDSLVTDLTAKTTGGAPVFEGTTTLEGAKVLGQAVSIDEHGIEPAAGTTATTDPLRGILGGVTTSVVTTANDLLKAAGISITMVSPVQSGDEKAGQLVAAGLRVDLELSRDTQPGVEQLLDALPSLPIAVPSGPSFADLVSLAQARHLSHVDFGQASLLLTTTTLATSTKAPTPAASSPSASSTAASSPASSGSGARTTASPAAAPLSPNTTPASAPADLSFAAGLGALILLVLLALPFIGDRIATLAQRVLTADGASACSWEER
jgi:hypothetical protein